MPEYAHVSLRQSPATIDIPRDYNAACEFLDRHVEQDRGDRPAMIDADGRYTYADLHRRAARAGNALRDAGFGMETRVMMCMLDTVDFPTVFLGAMKAGMVPIPINTLLTSTDYEYMLRDSRAAVLVVSEALLERLAPVLEGQPHLRRVIVSGHNGHGHDRLSDLLEAASEDLPPAPTTSDDVAFWLYSSGSTGRPKGAMHLHRDLVHTAVHYGQEVLGVQPDDLHFSVPKMFFAYGLGNSITFPMYAGACALVMAERPTPASVLATMGAHHPTVFFGVPTLYSAILADPDPAWTEAASRLRLGVSAGEALPEGVGRRWEERFGVEILDGLGSTEMLHIFLSNRRGHVRYGTSGDAPVPGYRLRIVGEDGGELPPGEIGELLVSGPTAAVAYWNQRDRSLDTFHGPWTRTGDKYSRDADGYYIYSGRSDDMLKVSGMWVSPFEVESALAEHPDVLEVAVVGQTDADSLVKPKAFIVLKDPSRADDALAEELRQFVKSRLARFKYPRWVEFVDGLPKTATGKIQRFRLRDGQEAGR
jgi:benzoate-CoA ligase family protein